MVALSLIAGSVTDTVTLRNIVVAPAETLTVALQGEGTPVVLVPGLFGSRYAFRQLTPALAAVGFRTIVIEPLGIGTSARPREADYSLTAQAGRIAAAMDSLGVEDCVVVAHSVGAGITYRLALLRPELLAGIVSIEGGPAESATTPGLRFWLRFAGVLRFGGSGVLLAQVERSLKSASGDPSWVTREVVQGYTMGIAADLGASVGALRGMARSREPWPLGPALSRLRCPVHLLVGAAEHDSGIDQGEVAQLAAALPAFTVDSIPGVGHYIFEERPAAVVRAVQQLHRELVRPEP